MTLNSGLRWLRTTLGRFRWNGRNSVAAGYPKATLRPCGSQLYSDNYFWCLATIINSRKSHLSFLTQPQLKLS